MTQRWSADEERQLASYLSDRVCSSASGSLFDECLYNPPRDVYFIGNLRSVEVDDDRHGPQFNEMLNKLSPVAFGLEMCLRASELPISLTVTLQWSCYYRVFPSYDEQRSHQGNVGSETQSANGVRDGQGGSAGGARGIGTSRDSLFLKFRKLQCSATGRIVVTQDDTGESSVEDSELRTNIRSEIERVSQLLSSDPDHFRIGSNPNSPVNIPASSLNNEASFRSFLAGLTNSVTPAWSWDICYEVDHAPNGQRLHLAIEFVNTSTVVARLDICEPFLFDTSASIEVSAGVAVQIPLYAIPGGWRFDRRIWARGINCNVNTSAEPTTRFSTDHAPQFIQPRYVSRDTPVTPFTDLAADPIPVLDQVVRAMRSYLSRWHELREQYVNDGENWEDKYGPEFDSDFRKYETEIELFERGVELISENADAATAFRLTNETFARGPNSSWRLFQLVFLVCQIPGIVSLETGDDRDLAERSIVDIVYFPTGGGKTEAYLGTIVFHCFFDRLRGKQAGVTAWTRFPLRLLTLQQTQRAADMVGLAELVRREQTDTRLVGVGVDGFAVGYFVGGGGSPNSLSPPYGDRPPSAEWSQANDSQRRQAWKRVVRCPACGTNSVVVDFDAEKSRLSHRCTNSTCAFLRGELPVYVVDYEVFRYLPCLVVGTIDKLASIGNQRRMVQLFGDVDGRCSEHGYYKGQCCQKECQDPSRLDHDVPIGLSAPTLFVQDELHLIKEGLGTFDAHYESYVQELCRIKNSPHPLKIIASSATIEAFERQVEHLYGRERRFARIFPGPGPSNQESFYANTLDYAQRMFVGVLPHNKTLFNATLELLEYYHRAVHHLKYLPDGSANPYGGRLAPASDAYRNLLDKYCTSLTYFLANRDLDSIRNDLEGDVVPNLQRDNIVPPVISQLTGSVDTDTVSSVLERMETDSTDVDRQDAVLATSMISHGVDVDRFNCMVFYGVPRQNAEYIQASSRVGRSHLGLVFTCIHPARERDHSHYKYFCKFHEYLGKLVEPVAINRWSKFSIQRTLPGLVMASILQIIAYRDSSIKPGRFYFLDFVKQKIADRTIAPEEIVAILEAAYLVYSSTPQAVDAFRNEIQSLVPRLLFDQIGNASSTKNFVSEALIPAPMISLRDVDEAIRIELTQLGTNWATRISRR